MSASTASFNALHSLRSSSMSDPPKLFALQSGSSSSPASLEPSPAALQLQHRPPCGTSGRSKSTRMLFWSKPAVSVDALGLESEAEECSATSTPPSWCCCWWRAQSWKSSLKEAIGSGGGASGSRSESSGPSGESSVPRAAFGTWHAAEEKSVKRPARENRAPFLKVSRLRDRSDCKLMIQQEWTVRKKEVR